MTAREEFGQELSAIEYVAGLEAAWDREFPGVVPLLDNREPHRRWVRFHSLPESKRYPETDDEMRHVLRLHERILTSLRDSTPGEPLLVVGSTWYGAGDPVGPPPQGLDGAILWRIERSWNEDDEVDAALWVSTRYQRAEQLTDLLTAVAEGPGGPILITTPSLSWRYHPYDGGGDVVAVDRRQRRRIAWEFRERLSPRRDGM
ncbi:hypothetical protein ACI2IX_10990 [Leifsonia aquatica]|uniref:DUF3885 domain-containing protein n=1 Tax=Leifsonia aquatica TaxID=144185 RepID=UPI00384B68AD